MLKQRQTIRIVRSSPFKWDGSHLGTLGLDQVYEHDTIKIGRLLKVCDITVNQQTATCLVKSIESLIPAILDELKPIFSLEKIGTHTFRHNSRLMIAYKPNMIRDEIFPELTLDNIHQGLAKKIADQVRLNLAFREVFGITDTHEKSLVVRYKNPSDLAEIPRVISFLEPGSVAGQEDGLESILSQTVIDRWFPYDDPNKTIERAVADLICLNRDSPETSLGYYRPLVQEIINRLDPNLITYLDLFFDRLSLHLPY